LTYDTNVRAMTTRAHTKALRLQEAVSRQNDQTTVVSDKSRQSNQTVVPDEETPQDEGTAVDAGPEDQGVEETTDKFEQEEALINDEGILCRFKTNTNPKTRNFKKLQEFKVIPVSLRKEVLELAHSFTHYGIERMLKVLESSGYRWDVRQFVLGCRGCATSKKGL